MKQKEQPEASNSRGLRRRLGDWLHKQPPARVIAVSFLALILIGSGLLMLPCSVVDGVSLKYEDALFISTSASTTTGLTTVSVGKTFSVFGKVILCLLMQLGSLGVTVFGVGAVLALRRKVSLKERLLFAASMNVSSGNGMYRFVRKVLLYTFAVETVGTLLSFAVFVQDFEPWTALGISVFHAVSTFSCAGLDLLGGASFAAYRTNVWFNVVTIVMMLVSNLGFLVFSDLVESKGRWKKIPLNTKVILWMQLVGLVIGTLLIKVTQYDRLSWLTALFTYVSGQGTGFVTQDPAGFAPAAIFVLYVVLFVGGAPCSCTGGIRTTTLYLLLLRLQKVTTNREGKCFGYRIPDKTYDKALSLCVAAVVTVLIGTFLVAVMEPKLSLTAVLFENLSAFATTGMSMGITTQYGVGSKLVESAMMYIGRAGVMTIATMGFRFANKHVYYPEGEIVIG